jgi:hypothetical protein
MDNQTVRRRIVKKQHQQLHVLCRLRRSKNIRGNPSFIDIIVIATCNVIGGATGWEQMDIFQRVKYEWFIYFLEIHFAITLMYFF